MFVRHKILIATQLYETVGPASLADISSRCRWSKRQTYDLNALAQDHACC